MTRIVAALTAVAVALAASQPAFAEPKHKGKGKGKNQAPVAERDATDLLVGASITAAEVTIIHRYIQRYGSESFGPPHGLPPGIAKNLARGKPLPPGIAKRYVPRALLAELPPRPGYEWIVVDRDILLVAAATAVVIGVLTNVL